MPISSPPNPTTPSAGGEAEAPPEATLRECTAMLCLTLLGISRTWLAERGSTHGVNSMTRQSERVIYWRHGEEPPK